MDTLIVALIAFLAGCAVSGVIVHIRGLHRQIDELRAANRRHLPYRTADEIENATAVLNSEIFHTEFRRELIENALHHLWNARNPEKQ